MPRYEPLEWSTPQHNSRPQLLGLGPDLPKPWLDKPGLPNPAVPIPSKRCQTQYNSPSGISKEFLEQIRDNTLSSTPYFLRFFFRPVETLSRFYSGQLPPLDPERCPGLSYGKVKIEFGDPFVLTRAMRTGRKDWKSKVAVLNCASDVEVAGGWKYRVGTTAEQMMRYSSTLFDTLQRWAFKYPWQRRCLPTTDRNPGDCAGIFSPLVYIFKDELANQCRALERKDMISLSVISVAGLACPTTVVTREGKGVMKSPKDKLKLIERIRMVLRMAGHNRKTVLMLTAMSYGAWGCPPREMAQLMKVVLGEEEFQGWFEEVRVGIHDHDVCEVFRDVFSDFEEGSGKGTQEQESDWLS